MRYAALVGAMALMMGCASGTEPEEDTQSEEIAIRLRVEIEEPRLVRRQGNAAAMASAVSGPASMPAVGDSLMCIAE